MSQTAADTATALARFEPAIRSWFTEELGAPTEIQALTWPVIAAGGHALVTAPTGSGKTLTAFLWALNEFAAGRCEPGATRVLYVSPLKALNNDIQRNLLTPLAALTARNAVPPLRVETRSGDTPQNERQRMLRRPPEILITTPESLVLLLTTARGRHALAGVETVILDEVHALADNRRGTLVLTALERLVHIAGEFQRIALSATVRPVDRIARYLAGTDAAGLPRAMRTLEVRHGKEIRLAVRFPEAARNAADNGQKIWEPLAQAFRQIIEHNRATLFFTNSRRLAEKLTLAINRDLDEPLAYAHHGSLAREIRLTVEERLKNGELKAIVATSSLEMGIDIGALDEVVMIQAPPTIAATLQRIGRAGHRVGEVSRAALFPTFGMDFVAAAALAAGVAERDIEPLTPLENPLDVLAQIIVSMTATEPWAVDALYALLRRSGPYRRLPRAHFDLVIEMLAGRYAGSRVRELRSRISYDRIRQVVKAGHGAQLALYSSGGVIPNRGYFQIRHVDSGAVIGELDEEFVWEATPGQVFTLGTQNWQIQRITHNDVLVRPTASRTTTPPFWRAESQSRSFHYAARILAFLEAAEAHLERGDGAGLRAKLIGQGFEAAAAEELADYLERQRQASGAPLPHRRHLLVEHIAAGPGGYRGPDEARQLVLHTFWGGRVNLPWALALGAALHGQGVDCDIHSDDNAVVVQTREPLDAGSLLGLVTPTNLEPLLRQSLETSGFFGARFREAAGRALLLTRQRFNARLPLWMSRLQAKKLMTAVAPFGDFPVLLEAWRTCLNDEFDLPALQSCLSGVEDGTVAVTSRATASPSPFASNLSFDQISRYMYADDSPERRDPSALSDELIRSALHDVDLRPRLDAETVALFVGKRQRTAPGYAADSPEDWADWVKERILLADDSDAPAVHADLVWIDLGGRRWLTHKELLHALLTTGLAAGARVPTPVPEVQDPRSAEQLALEILSFHGPLSAARIDEILPCVPEGLLADEDTLVRGALLRDDETTYFCDPDNYEALLRLQRALRRPSFEPRPARDLPGYLAAWQGLGDGLPPDEYLELLRGYRAPVTLWLQDLPAARDLHAETQDLERAFGDLGLAWQGAGSGQIRLGYAEDLALLDEPDPQARPEPAAELFADPAARYGFLQLAEQQSAALVQFNERWWQCVWAGEVAADTLAPLRQGAARDYRLSAHGPSHRARSDRGRPQTGRPSHGRLRAPRYARSAFAEPWSGTWQLLARPEAEPDPLVALEDAKERARMLLDRYGLACRELANREGGLLRWSAVFRALRIMELAGEVLAGYFFAGLSGPQFVPPSALSALQARAPAPGHFWINALDPVSPCGLGLDWPELPQRRSQNYLAFQAGALALVVENLGKRLTFLLPPDHPDLAEAVAPLRFLLARDRRVSLEQINAVPARESPYLPTLARLARVVSDHRVSYLEAH